MDSTIRILRVLGNLNCGGIETNILNLYRKIDREKIQFDFVIHTMEKCTYEDEVTKLGGRIYRIPNFTGKNYFSYKKAWINLFKDHPEYKILHSHIRSTASIYIPLAKKYGMITIAHSHSTSSGVGLTSLVKDILQFPIRYEADYLLACSIDAGEWLFGKKSLTKDNFKVIYNSIDTQKYIYSESVRENMRGKLGIGQNTFVVGNVARLCQPKNHKFLLKVFKRILMKQKDAVLLLVGDGSLRLEIEKQIREMNLEKNIIMTGETSEVYNMLQAMDVFVFPSLYEGFGNVLIEAQCNGLPCIISDRVPKETHIISSLITELSLDTDIDIWADMILTHKRQLNAAYRDIITRAGFDSTETAKWYQRLYSELYKSGTAISLNNF